MPLVEQHDIHSLHECYEYHPVEDCNVQPFFNKDDLVILREYSRLPEMNKTYNLMHCTLLHLQRKRKLSQILAVNQNSLTPYS